MMSYLEGQILSKSKSQKILTIQAGRVGYEIFSPTPLFERIEIPQEINLWIHTHLREDLIQFYGFSDKRDRDFFRLLISVSGLGPKTALSILSLFPVSTVIQSILDRDVDTLVKVPGVGKKLAERLILETVTKLEKNEEWLCSNEISPHLKKSNLENEHDLKKLRIDLISALENLGYSFPLVIKAVDQIFYQNREKEGKLDIFLKEALQILSHRVTKTI